MPEQKILLSQTPTASHHVIVHNDQGKNATLSLETKFDFTFYDVTTLTWFLEAVKADKSIRHTYSPHGDTYSLEYDPASQGLERFTITRGDNGRSISMGLATAYKLLDSLSGNTERLVKED